MSREKQNECLNYDKEFNCCKVLSDWGQPMPVLQPCVESPCKYYEPCDANKEKLLINDLKSNNSEDMRNKQIEEMAKVLCNNCAGNESPCHLAKSDKMCQVVQREAEALYNAGYRKQSDGEWREDFDGDCYCTACGYYPKKDVKNFCPNCGAKMKGGAE